MRGPLRSLNPATGEAVGAIDVTPTTEIPAIVARARAALPAWRALGCEGRRDLLRLAGAALADRADALSVLVCREMGKPRRDASAEIRSCVAGLGDDLDEVVSALAPEVLDDGRTRTTVYRDPYGVCAAIAPWNFPVMMPHSLVVPALMAGNTVVLKPSELTPISAGAWAEILMGVLPPDVLQVIHGDDEQGRALVQSDVDLVAFTGSRDAGAQILAASGPALKRVVLELGGKDPMVVLADADVEAAARFAARNAFRNAGQVCVSTERIYVEQGVADAFERRLAELASALKVGDGEQDDTDVGPMIHPRQKARVVAQVQAALEAGATLSCGTAADLEAEGNFLRPLVLTGVDQQMALMREETFGPVVGVMRFEGDDEGVALANDTRYGLGATVFGAEAHALEVARRLDAGMVGVNRSVGGARGAPWVGAKQSGYGFHSGIHGHRQFAQVRTVSSASTEPR
jgi:succinate-semialdehyde dehydrogenase/glutarate-semialdehyde dehydrogenase